jgi:hypothetical protein
MQPAPFNSTLPNYPRKEICMAKAASKPIECEDPKKDFPLAVRTYRQDIKPAQAKISVLAQEMSTAFKQIKKQGFIQAGAAKLAFKLNEMEEAQRDDFLRCFNGMLNELQIFMPVDMLDMAEGAEVGRSVIPVDFGKRDNSADLMLDGEGDPDISDVLSEMDSEENGDAE